MLLIIVSEKNKVLKIQRKKLMICENYIFKLKIYAFINKLIKNRNYLSENITIYL